MSGIRSNLPVDRLPGVSALYRDFIARTDAPVHEHVGGFRSGAAAWSQALRAPAQVDARVVDRMLEFNTALGVSKPVLERLRALSDGSTRVVITGQQPGVVGGPLLSLYKAATAIALAREIEARHGTRCVPVFWLGADDDDFAEIRDLTLLDRADSLVSVSVDISAHAPGRRVGDVAGAAVAQVWKAVRSLLPAGGAVARVDQWVEGGADLGAIAARALVGLTGGHIAVIDGRERALRDAARDTMLAFFDREDEIRAGVRDDGAALLAHGYHAQLDMGTDSGLFWVEDGVRRRIPPDARATARAAFTKDIGVASPGVVARNLLQDAVFTPVAVVLGPAEIAYRAQLARAYATLGVARPVVFPRLAGTFVPPAVREAVAKSNVDATLLAMDPGAWAAGVTKSLESPRAAEGARAFEAALRTEAGRFLAATSERLDDRTREKLERRVADLMQRATSVAQGAIEQDALAGASRWPWLARAAELFVRDGTRQERYLSALVPYTFHGDEAVALVDEIAESHVRDALDGQVLHRVYSR